MTILTYTILQLFLQNYQNFQRPQNKLPLSTNVFVQVVLGWCQVEYSKWTESFLDNLMMMIWQIPDDMMTYWMIDNSSKVGSCSLDGSYSRTVLYSPSYLRHPFSISVFEVLDILNLYNHRNIYHWRSQDLMYWTEWDSHRIYEANKFNGANVTTVTTTSLVSKQTA